MHKNYKNTGDLPEASKLYKTFVNEQNSWTATQHHLQLEEHPYVERFIVCGQTNIGSSNRGMSRKDWLPLQWYCTYDLIGECDVESNFGDKFSWISSAYTMHMMNGNGQDESGELLEE